MSHEVALLKNCIHPNHTVMHFKSQNISSTLFYLWYIWENVLNKSLWIRDAVISALVSDYTGLFTHCPHLSLWQSVFAQPTCVHVCDFMDLDCFWPVYKHSSVLPAAILSSPLSLDKEITSEFAWLSVEANKKNC